MENAGERPTAHRKAGGRQEDWARLETRLAETLGCLEEDHCLTIHTRDEEPYFVHFCAGGADGMLVEAASNRCLHGWRRLDRTGEGRLRRLGWRPPTDIGDGPKGWWKSFAAPVSTPPVATLAVATLTKAFDVARVSALTYRAGSQAGAEILLPTLGLERTPDGPGDQSLSQRAEQALKRFLEVDELIRDADGETPIRSDDAMVYVRVMAERNFVAVYSRALLDVTRTAGLVDAVNEINNRIRVARASVTDHGVMFAAEVDDVPGAEASVINAVQAVSSLANEFGADLQSRFGGRTFFQEPAVEPDQHIGLYL